MSRTAPKKFKVVVLGDEAAGRHSPSISIYFHQFLSISDVFYAVSDVFYAVSSG